MKEGLELLFRPRSIAVIGASREPTKLGYAVLKNIVESGYKGKVYPVNPHADQIMGLKAYKSVLDIPDEVDEAVFVIPAPAVPSALEECGKKGVKYAVIISAGFKEIGGEGVEREKRVVEIAKKYGIRVLGPNILGVIDTHTPLNASFGLTPPKGGIAFVSQSGAYLAAIIDWSVKTGIGFSKIISLGNKADLNEIDFIEYLAEDPATKVILLYLESIANPKKFIEVASEVVKKKPILLIKGGMTEAGARAALSHTGSMAGGPLAVQTAMKKAGIVLVSEPIEFFDSAIAFSLMESLPGDRIAIVTNAGGPGVMTADLVALSGLKLAQLSPQTVEYLRSKLPPMAALNNPIDVIGDARSDRYEVALDAVLKDPNVDAAIVILTPQVVTEPEKTAEVIINMHKRYPQKPILAAFIGGPRVEKAIEMLKAAGIPVYESNDRAVTALAIMNRYRVMRERVMEIAKSVSELANLPDIDEKSARALIESVRSEGRKVLLEVEAKELVSYYGIPVATTRLARSEDEAVAIANELGYPVVLKIASPDIIHKSDIGGVKLNLKSESDVREAFRAIMANVKKNAPQAQIYGVVVQTMAPAGREVIVGAVKDPQFGHMIMFGLGGIYTEVFRDVSFSLAPITSYEAREMIMETKSYRLLKGFRGEKPADIEAIVNVLVRASRLVMDIPEIAEMDLNPIFVYEEGKGCKVVDARIVLE
ncbi:MAG: acetate--CoA ligase family protein [Ignisphaera sp.]